MDEMTQALFEARAKVIKALANPARLYMVDRLSERDYCVHELADLVGSDISTISRHLSVLKNANIVKDEKSGKKVYYTLAVPCVLNFFSCVENVMTCAVEEQSKLIGKE